MKGLESRVSIDRSLVTVFSSLAGNIRRRHLLVAEDQTAELGADLGVVDDEGGLAYEVYCQLAVC